ncbi:DNA phosphorothioation system sulfurtransferase DndC [Desulfonatronum thioautotrophicum]|uniref:DNA phosphorothioation system sulfurtransferase DndC n=1 Tax=Desulfonatronum thioautotrophicum TaxID=617001 RepID=UPI000ABD21DE|nr:DNA phosphorothioation system sulfurtransferase DndC [Desulfonatronum thioautotrophicum]
MEQQTLQEQTPGYAERSEMEPVHKETVVPPKAPSARASAFQCLGFKPAIDLLHEEIRELYLADDTPWIIGYSGGKDSTAIVQLIWTALADLPPGQRTKTIHVITTDTMVENPVVSIWVANSLQQMRLAAAEQDMPFQPHQLRPKLADTFWVNLLGKGYPAPRHKFRWCTLRLKITPSNTFISKIVSGSGEAILVLGTRKAESAARAASMTRHEKGRVRDRLSPNSGLPGSLVYTPIEDWTNDDVWFYLMQVKNPWGWSNRDLLNMYAGATADGECPLIVDESTPSCGNSRFGCWVCTMVEQDKSMSAMIQNDAEKEWMLPLLDIRNALDFRIDEAGNYSENADRHLRDFRRMSGAVQLMSSGREIPGPYIQSARENFLRMLLQAQAHIHLTGPEAVREMDLITLDELQEIRRIWVMDKHEIEDSLPRIYEEATGIPYPGRPLDDNLVIRDMEMQVLAEICGEDRLHYELIRELLSITRQMRSSGRRAGLYEKLEKAFQRHAYTGKDEAIAIAQQRAATKKDMENRRKDRLIRAMETRQPSTTEYNS